MKKKLFYYLSLTFFLSFAVSSFSFAAGEENIFTTNIGIGATSPFGLLQVGTTPNTGSPGLLVTAAGNVGIGKTAPAYKLDVTGEIKSDSALFLASSVNIDGATSSVDQKLASYTSALYWGRSRITSDVFDETLHNFGNLWTAKGTSASWRAVALSADGARQAAVGQNGQIYISSDYGNIWAAKESSRNWYSVAMSNDGSRQAAVVNSVTTNGYIYISTDYGSTWAARMTDSNRLWYSVALSADGSRSTAVVENGQIYISSDYGSTWAAKETNRTWLDVAMSSDGLRQAAVVDAGKIYISTDYGSTWAARMTDANRNWDGVAISADGSRQTAVVNSATTNGYIYVSTDYGSTWAARMTDANRGWVSVTMSADGSRQAAVVSAGQIYISTDYGNTWVAKDTNRSWYSVAMSSDGACSTAVAGSDFIYVSAAEKTKFLDNVGIGETSPLGLLQVGTTPTPGLLVTSAGNVGIGKTGPVHKLDVSGNLGLSASGYINFGATDGDSGYGFKDNAGVIQYKNSSGGWSGVSLVLTPAGSDGQVQYNNGGTAFGGAANLYYDNSGNNLGIGATNPFGLLQVGTSPNTGSPGLLVTAAGNVGIGKTAPAYKLDVTGEIKSDSALFLASSVNIDGTTSTVDQKLASYTSSLYWGRSKITSDIFDETLHNFGNTWTAKGTSANWRTVALSADGSRQAAVVYSATTNGYIYISSDYGNTWVAKVTDVNRSWWSVAISADGARQAAVVDSAATNGYIYISTDYGSTWAARMTDANRGWRSVAISADGSHQAAVVLSVTTNGYIYISTDYGSTWAAKMTDANRKWRDIAISADGSRQTAGIYGGQIYISSDYGNTWTARMTDSNRDWIGVAISADGSRQSAVVNAGKIYISTDYGSTWAAKMTDADRNWTDIAISADGSRQAAVVLSLTTNGYIYISTDYGSTWAAKMTDANRNWYGLAMSADGFRQSAVVSGGQIYVSTAEKTKFLDNVGIGETSPAGLLQVGTTPTPGLFVTSAGNVGIGKTGPVHKLDVSGNIGLIASGYLNFGAADGDSGYGFKYNAGAGTIQYKNSAASWVNLGSFSASGLGGQVQYNNAGELGGAINLYYDDSGNNLGIGATNPFGLLQVGTTPNTGSPGLLVTSAGNVGIGKTAPAYKLEVTGEIKSDSALFLTSAVNIDGTTSSVDQKLASYTSSLYWGRSKVTSDVFDEQLHNFGNLWTAKMTDANRDWQSVAMSADGARQAAVIRGGQIYVSSDYGSTWTAKMTDANRDWYGVAISADGSRSTAVVINGLIYISTDYGNTWVAKDTVRYWKNIAMSADGSRLTAVFYQPTPAKGNIYISSDYGNTWTARMTDADRKWENIAMSADGIRQAAVVYDGYIYISTDYGNTWTTRMTDANRFWWSIALSADGSRQSAVANTTTLNAGGYVYISSDYGNTWTAKITDDDRLWRGVAISNDGSRQAAVNRGLGSGGQIYISTDYGNTWTAKESNRSWFGITISADGSRQSAVVNVGQIYVSVSEKTKFLDNVGIGTTSPLGLLQVGTTPTPGLLVTSAGNVGIGNTAPGHKLDVSGNIGLNASAYLNFGATDGTSGYGFRDNAGTVQYKSSTGGWSGLELLPTPAGSDGQVQYNNGGTAFGGATNLYYDDSGNNVGIGATSPRGLLQVGTSPNLGSPGLLVTSAGNVGIGKTNPAYKLDVSGEIKSDSALFLASSVNIDGTTSSVDQKLASYSSSLYWGRSKVTSDVFDEGLHNFGNTWTDKMWESNRWWHAVALSADGSRQAAVVFSTSANGYIYVSSDYGNTWAPKMTDSNRGWYSVVMSGDGSRLTALVQNGKIYVSSDYGSTWAAKMTDSNRLWYSVATSADGIRQAAVVYNSYIYISSDYGNTWAARDTIRNWQSVALSADGARQSAVVYGGKIYVSSDYGNTWSVRMTDANRNWYSVAMSADGSRSTAAVWGGQIYVSTDYGATWAARETIRNWNGVAMSGDGSRQAAVNDNPGYIYISTDYGNTWSVRMTDANRNWYSVAMSADGSRSTAVVYPGQIYVSTAEKTRFLDNVGIGTTNPVGLLQVGATPAPGLLVTSAGNLGVGNTSPSHKLDVSGNVGLSASAYLNFGATDGDSGYGFKDNAGTVQYKNSSGSWTNFGQGGYPAAGSDGQAQYNNAGVLGGALNLYYDDSGNNVGIGATSPRGLLQVGTSPNLGSPGLLVTSAGNVGIGKTAPAYKLDVSGDIRTSSALFLASSVNISGTTSTVDQKLASYSSALYWGRSKITSDVFDEGLHNFGNLWSAKESDRIWEGVAMSSDGSRQAAVVNNGYIYISSDYGNTWAAKATVREWMPVAMSADGSRLTAGGGDSAGPESYLYISSDYGNTWAAKMTDANRNWEDVAMSADSLWQSAVVGSAAGPNGYIYISSDYGNTWTAKMTDDNRAWRGVVMSADGSRQAACYAIGKIYISTDYGNTWTIKTTSRRWYDIAMSADGSRLLAAVYADTGPNGYLYVSSDYGDTWSAKMTDANRPWKYVAMSADGARQVALEEGTARNIWVSSDYGNIWVMKKDTTFIWTGVAMSADGVHSTVTAFSNYIYISTAEKTKFLDNVGIGTTSPVGLLQVGTSPAPGLFVTAGGNVGIGNTNPQAMLQAGPSPNLGLSVISNGNVGIGTTAPAGLLQAGTLPSPGLFVTAGGNVGIGKTNPLAKLVVRGMNTGTSIAFNLENNAGADKVAILDNGNVGIGTTAPFSSLHILGSQSVKRTLSALAAYTALDTDYYIGLTFNGARTVTLPSAASAGEGRIYVIKDEGGVAGTSTKRISIDPAGSETIDGAATKTIITNYGALRVVCSSSTTWSSW